MPKLTIEEKPVEPSARVAEIGRQAMSLPLAEREALCTSLLLSLESEQPPLAAEEVRKAWDEEIGRRLAAYERGEVETIPGERVMAELRAKLASRRP